MRFAIRAGCLLLTVLAAAPLAAEPTKLVKQGTATQLQVKGKPMLLIAGELGNSSASSAATGGSLLGKFGNLKALMAKKPKSDKATA